MSHFFASIFNSTWWKIVFALDVVNDCFIDFAQVMEWANQLCQTTSCLEMPGNTWCSEIRAIFSKLQATWIRYRFYCTTRNQRDKYKEEKKLSISFFHNLQTWLKSMKSLELKAAMPWSDTTTMLTQSEMLLLSSSVINSRITPSTSLRAMTISEDSGPYPCPRWSGSLKYRDMNWGLYRRREQTLVKKNHAYELLSHW